MKGATQRSDTLPAAIVLGLLQLVLSSSPASAGAVGDPREVMERVAEHKWSEALEEPRRWSSAVLVIGLLEMAETTQNDALLEEIRELGERLGWRPGPRWYHADDHAIAQVYLDLYRLDRDPARIEPFRSVASRLLQPRRPSRKWYRPIDYWWSDALFMSPPALAKLAAVTGDGAYLELADRLWRESYETLYLPEQRLFHRDLRVRRETPEVFWLRGNAWVLAGLARWLEELPPDFAGEAFYRGVFQEMANRVLSVQAADGLWRSDLLGGDAAPGESSGSALLCYALAWGVRTGLLDAETYTPVVGRAWAALVERVDSEGRLGWVQGPATGPGEVVAAGSQPFGSGALLLAGSEVLRLSVASVP